MENIFKDEAKIKDFIQIQNNLQELKINSSEEEINYFIKRIPRHLLTSRDNLMIICRLFLSYVRTNYKQKSMNMIILFEKILKYLKTYLQDESSFFWNISFNIYYLKLFFYEEGLISIEQIINSCRFKISKLTNYFLPEIIEKEPDFYENEIKLKIKFPYSKEYINEFKELRKKYFKWLRYSNDYNDSFYREIEKDQLRLSIKTDDIDLFQKIISNLNLSLDSKIEESLIENNLSENTKITIVNYAIMFNSIKIFKFLIMNNVILDSDSVFFSISQQNFEIIHIIESKIPEIFQKDVLNFGIATWNNEIIEYAFDNYEFKFLEDDDSNVDNDENIMDVIKNTFAYGNLSFLHSFLLPFLRKHQEYTKRHIYEIICQSFSDFSFFVPEELLKYQGIDINYFSSSTMNMTFLLSLIGIYNTKGIEVLLKHPNIDVNSPGGRNLTPIQFACLKCLELKAIKMICDHPKFDFNLKDKNHNFDGFYISVYNGNTYSTEYFLNRYQIDDSKFLSFFTFCLEKHFYPNLKILMKHYLKKPSNENNLINFIKQLNSSGNVDYSKTLKKIYDELCIIIKTD